MGFHFNFNIFLKFLWPTLASNDHPPIEDLLAEFTRYTTEIYLLITVSQHRQPSMLLATSIIVSSHLKDNKPLVSVLSSCKIATIFYRLFFHLTKFKKMFPVYPAKAYMVIFIIINSPKNNCKYVSDIWPFCWPFWWDG